MNLFVLGPRALRDWISQVIEKTRPTLASSVPPLQLRIVDVERDADCLVKSEASRGDSDQSLWLEIPGSSGGETEVSFRIQVEGLSGFSTRAQQSFCAAAVDAHRRAQANALHRVIAGPFAHDVRGALSVVSLSRQLLEAGGDGRSLGSKLRRVDSKVTAALFDLSARTRCLAGAWPPDEEDEDLLAPTVSSLLAWFSDAHPDRSCQVEDVARVAAERAPSWLCVALGGALDGTARLSRGAIQIEMLADVATSASVRLRIVGETAALHPAQRSVLSRPERWSLVSSELVPYRLATAALLVESARGTIEAKELDGGLVISIILP